MKKIISLSIFTLIFVLAGCSSSSDLNSTQHEGDSTQASELNSDQSLAFSTYLASGFLSGTSDDSVQNMSYTSRTNGIRFLTTTDDQTTDDSFQIDTELDEVNIYFNKLKVFMEQGLDSAINIEETTSTRAEYDHQVTYTIDDVSYVIYYSYVESLSNEDSTNDDGDTTTTTDGAENMSATTEEDEEDEDKDDVDRDDEDKDDDDRDDEDKDEEDEEQEFKLVGLMVIDNVEYELVGANEIEEDETKMWFETIDTNDTGNYVHVEIKEEDGEQKFEIETVIDGVEKISEIKFEQEDNETKVELKIESGDTESSYEFKKEVEDGETVYKFEYEIGETEGEVKIYEIVDADGNISYKYEIEEEGKSKEVERGRGRGKDDEDEEKDKDDDDEEDNDEDNDEDDQSGDEESEDDENTDLQNSVDNNVALQTV
ncbi:hypothetical protein [Haloplasma contractile]|uniref:Membrane lipoprotein n=1 Tax=Haloplasma contractile SSD-17B TaxID=1033810 RepID=U2EER5_9MOLU|nr:hypothetical protein [Haloplasma contractile]ERJ13191.1 membrane lipoprotein [Haloplasma contractile SSD-17B]